MLIQVHGQEKPAIRGRTIAVAIGLLALSTGLAASLTGGSTGMRAETVITPRGWSVSVRAPAGAIALARPREKGGGILLGFPTPVGTLAQLRALRVHGTAEIDLLTAAEDVLASLGQRRPHAAGNLPVVWRDRLLGRHEAVEIWDPAGAGVAVRVGRVQSGEVYAVVFGPTRADPNSYDVFERFCRSFENLPE